MIRTLHYSRDGRTRTPLAPQDLPAALREPGGLLWVDFVDEPDASCEPILRETFGFHPLAVDDALRESHVPKIDDWGDYLYLVLHAVLFNGESNAGTHLDTLELDVFLGRSFVVTHHDRPIAAVDRVWDACTRSDPHLQRGADFLAYRLIDELVADFMPAVDSMEDTIDRIEDEVLESRGSKALERILALKRSLLHLHRIILPQREVLNRLARGDFAVVDAGDRVLFRDIYDHLVRLYDLAGNLRDLLASVMDIRLSVLNNRMNAIMRTLTIITVLFMPMSVIVGFFGMNFFQPVARRLAGWTAEPLLWATLALLVLAPAALYLWIRRKGWMRKES